ncbi:MAG: LysR substrate-binding domain-containing protein [Actinomycetota bacterium]
MAEFDRSLPPLATLVAFEAAHRHRNFTRAAAELFQSQTTVSRRIRELEADLGVTLFERHRYDATPTRHADELIGSVRLALGELSTAAERIRNTTGPDTLTVLSSLALTSALVAPAVSRFQTEHPDVSVRIVSACEPVETTREPFDIAIQYGPPASDRFNVHPIDDETVFPVCRPTFAERLVDPVSVADLADLPLVDVTYDDPSWVTWADYFAGHRDVHVNVSPRLTMTSYQSALDAAERGEGVALGWERSVKPNIDAGTLAEIPGHRRNGAAINAYLPRTPHRLTACLIDLIRPPRRS